MIDNLTKELETVKKTASDNASTIEALRSDLAKATEDITKAYKEAITSAINEYDGTFTTKIDTKVRELNSTIDTKVSEINTRIDALDTRVKTLEDSLSEIKSRISALQDEINTLKDKLSNIIGRMVSISHVPTYADGAENVPCSMSGSTVIPGTFMLRFELQPASLATDLAANWSTVLSVKAVYTKTRASTGDFVPLSIKSASASDGILSVTVSANGLDDAFFNGTMQVNCRLKISDGSNEILSEYVPLKPYATDGSYIENGINWGLGITVNETTWAPVNCGATSYNKYGEYFDHSSALKACPSGWRLPTIDELNQLASHYSGVTTWQETVGIWHYGNSTYVDNVPALFLPLAGYIPKSSISDGSIDSFRKCGVYRSSSKDYLSINTSLIVSQSENQKMSVRCVKK